MKFLLITPDLPRKWVIFITFFFCLFHTKAQESFRLNATGFIENKGQVYDQFYKVNKQAKYLLPLPGMNVVLGKNGFSYDTYNVIPVTTTRDKQPAGERSQAEPGAPVYEFHRIDIEFLNSNPEVIIQPETSASDYLNFYNAVTPDTGIRQVMHFQKVTYKNIYPNIDIEFIARPGQYKPVEYNFILHPGARLSDIQMRYNGFNAADCTDKKLTLRLAHGQLTEHIPSSFWLNNKKEEKITYRISGKEAHRFTLGFSGIASPVQNTFIIDPTPNLSWATYFGGSGADNWGYNTCDLNDNIIISGGTTSASAIATVGSFQSVHAGLYDLFLTKFDSNGTLIWATYFGGTGYDYPGRIITDNSGNILITGYTGSSASITTVGVHQPVFGGGAYDGLFAKFDPAGFRIWASYYGGNGNDFLDVITIDAQNNIVVAGSTSSNGNIATLGAHQTVYGGGDDAIIVKFNSSGIRLWGTYYGGTSSESANDMKTDAGNNLVLAGATISTNAIASPGAHQTVNGGGQDAYLLKLSAGGTRQWATFYGGTGADWAISVDIDMSDNIFISGMAGTGTNTGIASVGAHQPTSGGLSDSYLAKFSSGGVRQWGTYTGGTGHENSLDGCLDPNGDILLIGQTSSPNNIATPGAYQISLAGGNDVFLMKYNTSGIKQWGTYYGGTVLDVGSSVSLNSNNDIIASGRTQSSSGIATVGAYQTVYGGGGNDDVFVAKFAICTNPDIPGITSSNDSVCTGNSTILQISSGNLNSASGWQWYSGSCGTNPVGSGANITVSPATTTTYFARGEGGCITSALCDSIEITVLPAPALSISATQNPICPAVADTLSVSGGVLYNWSNNSVNDTIVVSPSVSTTYTVTGTDMNGCSDSATILVLVHTPPVLTLQLPADTLCLGGSLVPLTGGSPAGGTYSGQAVNNGSFDPALANPGYSLINYMLTDSNGCTVTSADSIWMDVCTAVSESLQNELRIFPNPAADFVYIESVAPCTIQLYNSLGQDVLMLKSIRKVNLNLREYANGIYTIRIDREDQEPVLRKLIIQR